MHDILLSQFLDDDDNVITTADTDPEAVSVSMRTTGEIVDVATAAARCRELGTDAFAELFVLCTQAAYGARYDSLLNDEHP